MKRIILAVAVATLLVGCKESVKNASEEFNALPPAVQKTVRAQAPEAEIVNVSRSTRDGQQVYVVTLKKGSATPKVEVALDGRLLSTELTTTAGKVERLLTPTGAVGTPFSALPLAVQNTIKSHAPDTKINKITRNEENGRVIYRVQFEGHPDMQVADDGTLVRDL